MDLCQGYPGSKGQRYPVALILYDGVNWQR